MSACRLILGDAIPDGDSEDGDSEDEDCEEVSEDGEEYKETSKVKKSMKGVSFSASSLKGP